MTGTNGKEGGFDIVFGQNVQKLGSVFTGTIIKGQIDNFAGKVERTILKRHEAKAKTAYGEVELKICEKNGIVYRYPEYESVKKLCEAAGVPFKVVYQASCEAEISE